MFRRAVLVAGAFVVLLLGCSSDDAPSTVGTASSVTQSSVDTTATTASTATTTPATVPLSPAASPQDAADEAWTRRDELGTLLRRAAERMRVLALENFIVFDRALRQPGRPGAGGAEGMAFS